MVTNESCKNFSKRNFRGVDLSGKDLHGVDLSGKDLRDANLKGANLRGADLGEADLRGADLSGANLRSVNFRCAFLVGTNLRGADLGSVDLSGADLSGADLRGADLRNADLSGANLSGADLRGALLPDDVPVVPHVDAAILAAIGPDGERLEMSCWHSKCGTRHDRAGWAIVLAGDAGKALEARLGTNAAAALIYAASTPGGCVVPDWHASNTDALADLRRRASEAEVEPETEPEKYGPEMR